ncbi:MAG: nucleotidyl transferase AbiEii/AbiGii toxin family protein [Candidatus Hydrothermarchaeales archaeon]
MFYETVFREFNKKGIQYVVADGIALNLHGVPRATADLDLCIAIEDENLKRIVEVLKVLGFRPRIPVKIEEFAIVENLKRWSEEKKMLAFTFWNPKKPYEEIDIFIHNPIDFHEIDSTKEVIEAEDIQIPIVSLDTLIALKRISNREQDRSDIAALEKIKKVEGKS